MDEEWFNDSNILYIHVTTWGLSSHLEQKLYDKNLFYLYLYKF